jgi:NADH:ubiquinone reductase (H+-translocating)
MQGGAHVAKLIARELRGGDPAQREAFAYHDKCSMATIGRSRAIAEIGKLHLSGLAAWVAWLALHLFFLIGFRNRISVLLHWTYSYFSYRRGARIILGLESMHK